MQKNGSLVNLHDLSQAEIEPFQCYREDIDEATVQVIQVY